jgi:crotonobetainyl-CoA:carnitine CoA-transferase CaiB-like acyl-CoA transferase
MADPATPLRGIRVLDLTNVLSGPFCTHQLAHLGAEVIKIERPGRGDLARQLGADPKLNDRDMGVSFLAQNAGKKSVTLNLKSAEGAAVFRRLADTADVVVENFRPGVMDRLGLGPDSLRKARPELIYCAISGFGQDGPWRDRAAYDQIVQGAAGVMSVTGSAQSGPLRVGYPIADTVGGLTAAFAIAAALNARPRGCVIDTSMLEATMATMAWAISNYLIAGVEPARHGNENPTSAPSGLFRTQDGHLNIAANKDQQWVALTDALGLAELRGRPAYRTREDRKANRHALAAELEVVLTTRPASHWIAVLSQANIPVGAVLTVPEILDHPQIAGRGFLARFDRVGGLGRPIAVVRTGVKIDGAPPSVATPPPTLGQDTDAVLDGIGLGPGYRDRLRREGVI